MTRSPMRVVCTWLAALCLALGVACTPVALDKLIPANGRGRAPATCRPRKTVKPSRATTAAPVVWLYHRIGVPDPRWPTLSVDRSRFAAQMQGLAGARSIVLTMPEITAAIRNSMRFPRNSVAVTFDDGLAEQFSAAKLLCSLGIPATFFVPTGRIGHPGYMTWQQLRWMNGTGLFAIEAHTVHHRDLLSLAPQRALDEIVQSRDAIGREIGVAPTAFAYPFGAADPYVEDLVRLAGFTVAFADRPQAGYNVFDLSRIEALDSTASLV